MINATKTFATNGPLAKLWPEYERRKVQVEMACAVESIIKSGGVLLAEAGTGTGKTLAYLVPAIASSGTTIISTGTKNLQEQIFFKDIRALEQALNVEINAVYLKGQDNYLCPRRLAEFLASPSVFSHDADKVAGLSKWAKTTTTGDRMELEGLPDDDPLWRQVCSTRDTRIGGKCPYLAECFVNKARQRAGRAKIVVVNHHLYFADLATKMRGGAILPKHDTVIFDEAHLIEDIATEFFSVSVSSSRVSRLLDDTKQTMKRSGLRNDLAENRRPGLIKGAKAISSELFTIFRQASGRTPLVPEQIDQHHTDGYHRLDCALDAVESSLMPLQGRDETVDHCIERLKTLRDDLGEILDQTSRGFVHWVETRDRTVILGASPIDVSTLLKEGVFFQIGAVVLVSATLSTKGDFSFLQNRLGLDFEVQKMSYKSPFDYQKQACIYLPRNIPDPRDERFVEHASDEAAALIELTRGGALVLCTSVRNMRAIHEALQDRVPGTLLLQGDAPKSTLLEQYNRDRTSVLCATTSFWQGVDLPGDSLRLVVIDKLPFSSPGEPLVAARIEHLRENGQNPFKEYQLPGAALNLKQGFGRLIRTKHDRGIVAILDRRLYTKSYGSEFLNSLPDCPRLFDIEDVKAWWSDNL